MFKKFLVCGQITHIGDITENTIASERENPKGLFEILDGDREGIATIIGKLLKVEEVYRGVKSNSKWVLTEVVI